MSPRVRNYLAGTEPDKAGNINADLNELIYIRSAIWSDIPVVAEEAARVRVAIKESNIDGAVKA